MKFDNKETLERYLLLHGCKSLSEAVEKKRKTVLKNPPPLDIPLQVVKIEGKTTPVKQMDPFEKEVDLVVSWDKQGITFKERDD